MTTPKADWYEAAQRAHMTYDRDVTAIRANDRLSYAGKQAAIARSWMAYRRTVDRARSEAEQAQASTVSQAERRLFDLTSKEPAAALVARDAYQRAETATDPEQALALFAQAERTGDAGLSRALLSVAVDRYRLHPKWRSLVQAWAEANPVFADDVQLYVRARTEPRSLETRLVEEAYLQPARPEELALLSDQQLTALAGDS